VDLIRGAAEPGIISGAAVPKEVGEGGFEAGVTLGGLLLVFLHLCVVAYYHSVHLLVLAV